MKALLLISALVSGTSFAQTLDVAGLKNLMTSKKATLESVSVGLSKKLTTTGKMVFSTGDCEYMVTSTQHVLKIEAEKMIILSKEKFSPKISAGCQAAGYSASTEENVVFYEPKPSLAADFADLDASAPNIKSIVQEGNIVTLSLAIPQRTVSGQNVIDNTTIKYDLSLSSFKNTILSQGNTYKTVTENIANVDVLTLDLTKVTFCATDNSDECVEGNYSDIVY